MKILRETTQERVYKQLRAELLSGRFHPGEKIPEAQLAEQFAVSRTPMREAIARLEQEGLLVSRPYKGYYARAYTGREIEDLLEARIVLEAAAAAASARRARGGDFTSLAKALTACEGASEMEEIVSVADANETFHLEIAKLAGNGWIATFLAVIQSHLAIARIGSLVDTDRRARVTEEHRAIFSAIAQGDPAGAEGAMRLHLGNAQAAFLAKLGDDLIGHRRQGLTKNETLS